MASLELKIPPLLLFFAVQLVMLCAMDWSWAHGAIAVIGWGMGFGIAVAGVLTFRVAKTTANPMSPEKASQIVQHGVYRYSRNPMYLGFVLATLGTVALTSSVWAFAWPIALAWYLWRYQIQPEERVLLSLFGDEYQQYRRQVACWIGWPAR